MKFIWVIIFVNLFSAQINEDNGIIERGCFCMILKQFVLSCLWYTKPVRGRHDYQLNQYMWLLDKESGGPMPDIVIPISHSDKHRRYKIALNHWSLKWYFKSESNHFDNVILWYNATPSTGMCNILHSDVPSHWNQPCLVQLPISVY